MNKRDLIDAISTRVGDKKTATEAENAVLDTIQATVAKGDKVAITGFGVFEKAVRPARTARNPATGASIKVPKSSVPKFRAGADFKAVVNGDKKIAAKKRHAAAPGGRPPRWRALPARSFPPGRGCAGWGRLSRGTARLGRERERG